MTVPTAATFHHNIFNSARGCAFNRNDFTVSDSAKPPVKSGDDVQRAIFIAKRFGTTLVLAAVLGPDCPPWLSCREKEWVRRSHECIMVRVLDPTGYKVVARLSAPGKRAPL
jgi:hypothetical protein